MTPSKVSSDQQTSLEALLKARQAAIDSIARIGVWLDSKTDRDIHDVDVRVELLELFYNEFLDKQLNIEDLNADEVKAREVTETDMLKVKSGLKRLGSKLSGNCPTLTINSSTMLQSSFIYTSDNMRYPIVNNSYDEFVHESKDSSKVLQFGFSRYYIKETAYDATEHFPLIDESYESAKQITEDEEIDKQSSAAVRFRPALNTNADQVEAFSKPQSKESQSLKMVNKELLEQSDHFELADATCDSNFLTSNKVSFTAVAKISKATDHDKIIWSSADRALQKFVHRHDCRSQRILWRDNPPGPVNKINTNDLHQALLKRQHYDASNYFVTRCRTLFIHHQQSSIMKAK